MQVNGPGRDLERECVWRAVLERQRQSGLSIRAFCRREEISEPSFYAWRRELLRRDQESIGVTGAVSEPSLGSSARRPSAAFVPVAITSSPEPVGRVLEVSRADGLRLSVWPGCDAALWQAALQVLSYKRLEEGVFRFPAVTSDARTVQVTAQELSLLLWGIDPSSVKRQKRYARSAS